MVGDIIIGDHIFSFNYVTIGKAHVVKDDTACHNKHNKDNKTQGIMEKNQWDVKHIRFRSGRLTSLDFVACYQICHIALLKEYEDSKRAFRRKYGTTDEKSGSAGVARCGTENRRSLGCGISGVECGTCGVEWSGVEWSGVWDLWSVGPVECGTAGVECGISSAEFHISAVEMGTAGMESVNSGAECESYGGHSETLI
ncbi:hypothetical protein G5714_004205 [Onychostoma macrolepis]|uniref:Uncharacterized protein n=1 Tax=Onychostoma macrolepis TaxID=369639 RepID=A0A7J6DBL2_9TELE|nr:hypothetical protein G5714_004205 [Onychostoma macrolepis]